MHLVEFSPITTAQLVQIGVFVVGFAATLYQLRRSAVAARVDNLLTLTKNHREIWQMVMDNADLEAVRDAKRVCASIDDLTPAERQWINFLLLHMATAYTLERSRLVTKNKAAGQDIARVISLPAVNAVWRQMRDFHTVKFQKYVDEVCAKYT